MSPIKSVLFLLWCISYQQQYTVSSFRMRRSHPVGKYEGVFERFLKSWLDVLSMFPHKKVKIYVTFLGSELSNIHYKMAKKLASHVKRLAKEDSDYIQEKIQLYRRELDKNLPQRNAFFSAINKAFHAQQASQFEDYIHNLKDWFYDYRPTMPEDETRKLLREVILENILKKLSARDQIKLEKALKRAVKEYRKTTDDDEEEFEWAMKMELISEMIMRNISKQLLLDW